MGAFAAFLWAWTGTPFATLDAQRDGWGEKGDPLALVHQGHELAHELGRVNLHHLDINPGPAAGLLGAIVLLAGVLLLFKRPGRVSAEAMAFTLSVGVLAIVSENMSHNARLLITAFPAVLVFAYRCERRHYAWLIAGTTILLVVMSALTYGGRSLPP